MFSISNELYFRPRCDQLGVDRSIVEMSIYINYPETCDTYKPCKDSFADMVQSRIATHISSVSLKFEFDDGKSNEFILTKCKKFPDTSIGALKRLRRDNNPNGRHFRFIVLSFRDTKVFVT